jgi:glutamine amidotransferase
MIAVVDYGLGNIGSVANILRKVGAEPVYTSDPETLRTASKLVLPGVGAFDTCMRNLRSSGLIPVLVECVLKREIPLLGICVGMQMLSRGSEEGTESGLGWIAARTVKFAGKADEELRIPHMGWNEVRPTRPIALFSGLETGARFYFVHSYHVVCDDPEDVVGEAIYGAPFTAALQRRNITGVQFHPEKSHKFGMRLISNFVGDSSC